MSAPFADRRAAGEALVEPVRALGLVEPIVLGLPRGGVPVGAALAAALRAPLDVLVARKVGLPGHEELGIGAIAEGGALVADPRTLAAHGVDDRRFARLADAERRELERRVRRYRGRRPLPDLSDRDVVLVDDGIATGVTAEAAVAAVRAAGARRVVLAAPVGAPETVARLRAVADDVVCPVQPERFAAVGQWYVDFAPTSDREVMRALAARPA